MTEEEKGVGRRRRGGGGEGEEEGNLIFIADSKLAELIRMDEERQLPDRYMSSGTEIRQT